MGCGRPCPAPDLRSLGSLTTYCPAPGIVVKRVGEGDGDGVSSVRWLAQALDGASSRQRPQVLMRLHAPASRTALARGEQPKPRR